MSGSINLESGTLAFGNPKTGTVHEFDLMILQLTIERVESMHRLPVQAGFPTATPSFLEALSKEVDALGFDGCTPTQAFQIWNLAAAAIASLKKNTKQNVSLVFGSTSTPATSVPVSASATTQTLDESKPNPESTTA